MVRLCCGCRLLWLPPGRPVIDGGMSSVDARLVPDGCRLGQRLCDLLAAADCLSRNSIVLGGARKA